MYLEAIPGLGAFAARSLASCDAEHLRRHANRALHNEVLLLRALDQLLAH